MTSTSSPSFSTTRWPSPPAHSVTIRAALQRVYELSGDTLSGSIRSKRLVRSREDLHNSRFSITSIATCWGFSDAGHVSHQFKTRFGISPSAYRARLDRQIAG
ncbi:MAG: helix-turn-helix domain-containing protein [Hyphomicrobiales bacterium]|nr:MAG: helix-turn-helix domain-containing protein [Hyphomicrobiales bacterium]